MEVVVRLRLVDIAGAAACDRLELDQLEPDLRRKRLRRGVELLRRERREAALVVRDRSHASTPSPGGSGAGNESGPYGSAGLVAGLLSELEPGERVLGLHDAGRAVAALQPHEVVQRAGLSDVLRDVRGTGGGTLPCLKSPIANLTSLSDFAIPWVFGTSSVSRSQPVVFADVTNHFACFAPMSESMPSFIASAPELRDRVARVDSLRAALVAEVAARAVPDSVLLRVRLEPLDLRLVAWVSDEAHPLGQRRRAEEVGVGLHRVALGDAAAAHDAERLLVDHVHPLLRDDVLLLAGIGVAGFEPRRDRADLAPEGLHVHDEVLHDRQVPHRRDHRDVARLGDVVHPRLAGEHGRAVHAHPARAADHHPAALAIRERPVVLVLDDVEDVEQRRPLGRVDLVLERAPARPRRRRSARS